MAQPFLGEVRIIPYTFPPRGWAECLGQLYPIGQNHALYTILGTTYGGDGRTTLGLPNLMGRSPMHFGTGPGLTPRILGQIVGTSTVTLIESQLPNHQHTAQASKQTDGGESTPTGTSYPAFMVRQATSTNPRAGILGYRASDANTATMATQALAAAGQSMAHENRQPCLGLNFCIALDGMYPSRN